MTIHRDELGIIMQHDIYDETKRCDGGDSANRTGLMALCGSAADQNVVYLFEQVGLGMRHPTQEPWNNTGNFTRDQLTCLVAGLAKSGHVDACNRLLKSHEERGWRCQNVDKDVPGSKKKWPDGPDWLAPDLRLHLRLCAGVSSKYYFVGWAALAASLIYNTKIKPEGEQLQFICQVVIAGPTWLKRYKQMHPDYRKSITDYFCGWRDQPEIATELINLLSREEYAI